MNRLVTVYDDKEPLNNVISALTLNVDEVFYVYHHTVSKEHFENIQKVIKKYKNVTIKFIKLIEDEKEINRLIKDKSNTIVDVGGAKYLSLLLFELAQKNGNDIIYYDDEENLLKSYKDHKVLKKKAFQLQIEDVLKLRGGVIQSHMHHSANDHFTRKIILELVERNLDNYPAFIRYITKLNSILNSSNNRGGRTYYLSEDRIRNIKTDACYKKVTGLFEIVDNKLTFKTNKLRELVMISGAFLENYLYIKLNESKKFDDVKMSAVIDFSDDKYNQPVRCEIDCLIIKNNKTLFVSCKSSKADTGALNEIYVHNSMFGNALSQPVLCLAEEMNKKYPSIYAKAEELGIYIIDRSSFRRGIVSSFEHILNNTYKYDQLPE